MLFVLSERNIKDNKIGDVIRFHTEKGVTASCNTLRKAEAPATRKNQVRLVKIWAWCVTRKDY